MSTKSIKTLSLVCPDCGGKMELTEDEKRACCPYCRHEMLIEKSDLAQLEYERRMARARADEDIRKLQAKGQFIRKFKGWLIALGVIAGILLISLLIPGSDLNSRAFPKTVDPFEGVSLSFSGMSGEGDAKVEYTDRNSVSFTEAFQFEIKPQTGLANGDTVTVKAKSAPGWRFEPSEKQFTVSGLTTWVTQTDQINGDNLAAIHKNTERLIREDWESILSSSYASEMTITPYKMYLFINDSDRFKAYNVLYDAYEVNVTRSDGSIFTIYAACQYSKLKLPADGILTADYGLLMGFNFGYNYGFAASHAFHGWTDVGKMEADLRYYRDGYRQAS